jgi:Tol biopolymer transport system component
VKRALVTAAFAALCVGLLPSSAAAAGRLAFAASNGPSSQVFTVAHGGTSQQITHDATGAQHPDWSPDGRSIAYDVGATWLAIANANGTGERRLSVDISAMDPSWSPDASHLAFTGVQYDENGNAEDTWIYVTATDSSSKQNIGPGSEPDWSPRGDWIVYRSTPARSGGCAGIWRMRPDGSDNAPVVPGNLNGSTCSGGGSDPSFSPNGKRVAFVSGDGRAIYTTSLHGGKRHRVVRDARTKTSPVFSPDGKRIAYSADSGLWMVKAKGGRPKRIASGSGYLTWR